MATLPATTYDPGRVIVKLDGDVMYGFTDGTMITVSPDADVINPTVGNQGYTVINHIRNYNYRVTFEIYHVSPFFKKVQSLNSRTNPQLISRPVSLSIFDPSTSDSFFCSSVWLMSDAERSWGANSESRQFTLYAVNGDISTNEVLGSLAIQSTLGIDPR